jgi:hypothetical protein
MWGDELRAQIDPAAAGWPSEVAAEWIEGALREAVEHALTAPSNPETALAALLADDFEGASELVPSARTSAVSDGNLTFWRASSIDPSLAPRARLAERIEQWRALLDGARNLRVELSLDHAAASDRTLDTRVVLRVSGDERDGAVQENVRWRADWRWSAGDSAHPKLRSLRLESFEDLRAKRRTFGDRTRAVFGGVACFGEEIVRGAPDYHMRQDRLSGQPYLGMHGLAIGDVDGDGLEDVYLPQPSGQPNRLFLHKSDGTVVENAHDAGVDFLDNCGPALLVDLDNDGDLDLAVAAGSNILVNWNDGTGHFKDGIVLKGIDEAEITSMTAADFDGDGDLDIYACRYVKGGVAGGAPVPYYAAENGASNFYWRNEGDHKFKEATAESGLAENNTRYSLAVIADDLDEDGIVDLYVVNDFGKSCFYKNDGKGHFVDAAPKLGLLNGGAGMGATCGDYDLDGHVDVYVTNMHVAAGMRIAENPQFMSANPELRPAYVRHARGNTLLRNKGDGTFEDVTDAAGVAPGGWAWGSVFLDWNDGAYESLFVPNGFATSAKSYDLGGFFWREVIAKSPPAQPAPPLPPIPPEYLDAWDAIRHFSLFEGWGWNGRERDYAYWNLGDGHFADASSAMGLDQLDDGRAAAPIDWDDDGRIDLLLRNRTGPRLRFLHNDHPAPGHFVSVELAGTRSNRDAIGAVVRIEAGGKKLRRAVVAAQGFMCAPSRRLHFGLGAATRIDRLEVRWPDGSRERYEGLDADRRYRIVQGAGGPQGGLTVREPRLHPALAEHPPEDLPIDPHPEERIVLFERMPLDAIELPLVEGTRKISSFAGAPLLVTLWSSGDPASRAIVEALGKQTQDLERAGVKSVVLARPDAATPGATGGATSTAEEILRASGLRARSGTADKRLILALEVVLVEELGPYDALSMPVQLLVDSTGELVVVYSGLRDLSRILADVETLKSVDPTSRYTEAFLGGHWVRYLGRDLDSVADTFAALNRSDLAQFYRNVARVRRPR